MAALQILGVEAKQAGWDMNVAAMRTRPSRRRDVIVPLGAIVGVNLCRNPPHGKIAVPKKVCGHLPASVTTGYFGSVFQFSNTTTGMPGSAVQTRLFFTTTEESRFT